MLGSSRRASAGRPRKWARLLLIAAILFATLTALVPTPLTNSNKALAATRMIKLPFASGSDWTVSQGYNTDPNAGGSHYNCLEWPGRSCSQYWTYKYSFDLKKVTGETAGQTVLSPVSGTIRWIDESYGGMSIDLGNGWAVAYFHTSIAPGLTEGQTIVQGQFMGTVAPPGQGGNGGFPHIHLTLWQTTDGGNWSRIATPFSGTQALDGYDFPNISGSPRNQYKGTVVRSSNTQVGQGETIPRQVAKLSPAHGAILNQSTVTLSWSPVSGATSYQVLVDDGGQTSPWVTGANWTTNTLATGTHTWKVRARNSAGTGAWSSTWRFSVTSVKAGNEIDDGAMVSTGVYTVKGTRQGMVGGTTSSGHVIVANDNFVSLPACLVGTQQSSTGSSCWWLLDDVQYDGNGNPYLPGGLAETYGGFTMCGAECFVMVLNPVTDKCVVAPVLDRGPWFNVDNYWDVPSKRFVNQKIAAKGLNYSLAQGYSAAPAALAGYDVGWGKTGNVGNTNLKSGGEHYPVGLNTSIDIGDGTWTALGFPWNPGPQTVTITMLWQVGMTVAQAKETCEGAPTGPPPYFTTSKTTGLPGAVITVNGKNFAANETVKIHLDSSKTPAIGTATTDANGRFTATFTVPDVVGGLHRIHAVGQTSKLRVGKDFKILPGATIDKPSGSPGLTVTLTGKNFAAGEVVDVYWDTSTTSSGNATADSSGVVTIKVKAPSLNGPHTAKLVGRTWKLSAKTTFSVVQRVKITPTTSEAGTTIKAIGTGWPASKTITFRWNSKTGTVLCSAISDANGYAECTFVPGITTQAGEYRIYGTNGSLSASALYTLTDFDGSGDPTETPTPMATETPVASPTNPPTTEASPTETATAEPVEPTETVEPTLEPTQAPEPVTVEFIAVADTAVLFSQPESGQAPESEGLLSAGGPESAVTYISFQVDGVGAGLVTGAQLVLTGGSGGGPGGDIGVLTGYIVDEAGTPLTLPTEGIQGAGTAEGITTTMGQVGPGDVVTLDVTLSVQADGQYTFVILGNPEHVLELISSEGAAPPKLILTVQE